MVTIRYKSEEAEAAARLERYAYARRVATARGVARARAYAARKSQQDSLVCADLRRQWEREVHQHAALADRALYDSQFRRGDGARAAAERSAALSAEARAEVRAWEAERALDSERHRVAAARVRVGAALRAAESEERTARQTAARRAAAAAERRRAQRRPKPAQAPPFAEPRAEARARARARAEGENAVTIALHAEAEAADGGDAERCAAPFEAARREVRASQAAQLRAAQRAAQARVAESAAAKREEKAREEREATERRERVAALAAPPAVDIDAHKIGAMEQRAAAERAAAGEADFAEMFLRGPFVQPPAKQRTIDTFSLAHVDALLPDEADGAVQLSPRPFAVSTAPLREETESEADDKMETDSESEAGAALQWRVPPEDLPKSAGEADEGGSTALAVRKDDRQDIDEKKRKEYEGQREEVTEAEDAGEDDDDDQENVEVEQIVMDTEPLVPSPPSVLPAKATPETNPLDRPHEQFLRSLTTLQERLARAAEVAAADAAATTWHTNLSISTMSSFLTGESMSRTTMDESATPDTDTSEDKGHHTSSSSSSGASYLSHSLRPHPTMTAEQLKAALIQLRARMRSA